MYSTCLRRMLMRRKYIFLKEDIKLLKIGVHSSTISEIFLLELTLLDLKKLLRIQK